MGNDKTYRVALTSKQIAALHEAADHELTRLNTQKYEVAETAEAHYDERMVAIRVKERLLRNAKERMDKAMEEEN